MKLRYKLFRNRDDGTGYLSQRGYDLPICYSDPSCTRDHTSSRLICRPTADAALNRVFRVTLKGAGRSSPSKFGGPGRASQR